MANIENRTVIGSYDSREEAMQVVDRLVSEGYTKDDITLYSNSETSGTIGDTRGVDVETTRGSSHEDESLWERIKDAFSVDTRDDEDYNDPDYDMEDDILQPFQSDLSSGNIVVLVSNYKGMDHSISDNTSVTGTQLNGDKHMNEHHHSDKELNTNDDQTLKLKEERLQVDKHNVKTGEVDVHKRTVTETKTVDIPVEHEEVVIERRPVRDGETVSDDFDSEDIHIPLTEEQVEVTKKPIVSEEVTVHKEKKQDVKHVSEEVEREELDVDTEGNVRVEDDAMDDDHKHSGNIHRNDSAKRSDRTGLNDNLNSTGANDWDDELRPTDGTGSDDHMDNI